PRDLLPDASWQHAVAGALEKLAATAARPAYGAVPADTNAVLFYDRAEVLASLARDWMSGTLPVQWWWRELFRGRDAITALLREWIEAPQYVPGALDLLAQRKDVVKFLQRLPQQPVTEVLDAVIKAYGLPRPGTEDSMPPPTPNEPVERSGLMPDRPKLQSRAQFMAFSALLSRWVPEAATPGLAPAHKRLLVQALMLRRAPAVARTMAFQKELLHWQAICDGLDEIEIHDFAGDQPSAPREASRPRSAGAGVLRPADATQEQEGLQPAFDRADDVEPILPELTRAERQIESENGDIIRPGRRGFRSASQAPMTSTGDDSGATEASSLKSVEDEKIGLERDLAGGPAAPIQESQAEPTPEPSITFATQYGGVFFLLGLALYLY